MTVEIGRDIDEFEVGMTRSYTRTFTAEDVARIAEITGDYNYFHVDEEAARHSVFGRRIVHGLLVTGMATHLGGVMFPGPGYIAFDLNVRYLKPVYIGDTVTCTLEITSVDRARNWLEMAIRWVNQDDDLVSEGTSSGRPTRVVYEAAGEHVFRVRQLEPVDRDWVACLLKAHWGDTKIASRGKLYAADELPGFAAMRGSEPVGLVTYRMDGNACEVVSLNSLAEGIGIGSALMDAVREAASAAGCRRLWLVTTNDNLPALRFYQKQGMKLVAVHRNAQDVARKLKPQIPEIGHADIPIRDEIELEMLL